jgi:SAM-dependent methyltransferase
MTVTDKHNIIPTLNNREKVILELGCGQQKQIKNAITIDMIDLPHIDIIADLNKGFSFLPDNSVDEIYSFHFLEHIDSLEFFMKEIYRILKKGGKKIGKVPHFSNPYFYSDYTHHHFFGLYTFSYFSKDNYYKRGVPNFYNTEDFKINKMKICFKSPFIVRNYIKMIWQIIFNSSKYMQEWYEGSFCYMIPAYEIEFEIEKK